MKEEPRALVVYRLERAQECLEEAKIHNRFLDGTSRP